MDFGTLLHVAKKNSETTTKNSEGKYYSTKFSAPKKESKEKKLSDNIKRFLAKKEQEEREKARIEKEKREQLLALRDEKSKNKIKKMLKVIKSANKSVLEDAVDTENTAITLQGPEQPDEDDYGYVSQEAAAFYQKYVEKVKNVKDEKNFAPSRPSSKTDLSNTKDRVRAALMREQEEKNSGRTRSSSSTETKSSSLTESKEPRKSKNLYDPQLEKEMEELKKKEEEQKKAKLRKPAPPIMDFKSLLKLAEKKQYEPVEVVVDVKKEPERLLTKKEKKEQEERQKYLEEKEKRKRETEKMTKMQQNGKIPKLNGLTSSAGADTKETKNDKNIKLTTSHKPAITQSSSKDTFKKPIALQNSQKISSDSKLLKPHSSVSAPSAKVLNTSSHKEKKCAQTSLPSKSGNPQSALPNKSNLIGNGNGLRKDTFPKDNKSNKPRQFPPPDVQKSRPYSSDLKNIKPTLGVQKSKQIPVHLKSSKPPQKALKRRIYDDDDDEYDSELDDFIDDGPEEEDYSKHIKEIFGYDKSRYRDLDEDDAGMESTFAQQMREEYVSKKIGIMEDLEDMRMEAEEKKTKAIKKKKLK